GMGMGGMGMMRVPAERQLKLKVTTVCLEHGKADPSPRVAYKMIPAEQFTQDARVLEVCRLLGYSRMTQNVAQAAAWHLTDGLAWIELRNKVKSENPMTRQVTMWFHPQELLQASYVVASTNHLNNETSTSAVGKSDSSYETN
ncbi:MAG TPA: hypothetical protein DDZ51_02385, partial [Planctomycetaceae bacterium]|nr:hypothetical protein [Planctomycetaceae bacterium]